MSKEIQVVPYDPNWPHIYEKEAALIRQALGGNCLAIHHIGSTAVPGLAAKPKIDMIAVVGNIKHATQPMKNMGYTYKGEYTIPLRAYFNDKDAKDQFHIHMYEEFHPEIELNLCFRDYLRNHTNKRDEYARLKEGLVQDESSFTKENSPFTNYTLRKGDFIRNVLKEAGFNRIRMLKCNDNTEWAAAQHFRNTYFFGPHGIEDPYTWTFNHEEHAHLVLYQGTEIVAYAHIQFWPDKRAAIRIIATDENKRNQNSGSQFLALIEKWLKSLGVKSIHAESRQSSLRFYLKNGYTNMPFDDPENHEYDPNDVPVGKLL
jgi:GrpB-like predicted nucleotidyltransferase (UPF0157 family)/GNAT superfamily N-acetyltransferase